MEYSKHDYLYEKIINKLNSEIIQSNEEIINLYDLKNIVGEELKRYNYLLIDKQPVFVNIINKRAKNSLFSKKDYPLLKEIESFIVSEGNIYVRFIFESNEKRPYILFSYNKNNEVIVPATNLYHNEAASFLNKNRLEIEAYLTTLELFKEEYPNTGYTFSSNMNNKHDQIIKDGIFQACIYLNNPNYSHYGLENYNDIYAATSKTQKYGKLYDYIDLYQDELMKKTSVNINDLDPFVKDVVVKHLNKSNVKKVLK